MPPAYSLKPYQQIISDFIVDRAHCGVYLTMGGGKSLCTLDAMSRVRPNGHILVVAPLTIARSTWIDEIEKWRFPLRTQSLLVDESDRKLSKEQRLERFAGIFTDPPTMYFINRELLTQSSQKKNLLVPTQQGPTSPLSDLAIEVLNMISTGPLLGQEETVDAYRALLEGKGVARLPAKARINAAIKELVDRAGLVREKRDCSQCSGKGCPQCRFGLIDQMPVERVGNRRTILWPFPTVIIDESQSFKNPRADKFKAMKKVRPAILRLVELTGTPTPQGLLDLWAQVYLIDEGLALGKSFSEYRAKYFVPTAHANGRPVKWEILPGASEEIYNRVKQLVMSSENADVPLPDVDETVVNVTMPMGAMAAYNRFRKDLVIKYAHPDPNNPSRITITADNSAILVNKLRQFASGSLYTGDDHEKDFITTHTEKLAMVSYLLNNCGNEPAIVAYHSKAAKVQLMEYLTRDGHTVEVFDGSRAMKARWNDKQIPVMLLQPASAGHGLNLQDGGRNLIWHALPDALELFLQANSRLIRIGQNHTVRIWMLMTKGTEDAKSLRKLRTKQMVQQGFLDAVKVTAEEREELFAGLEDDMEDIIGAMDNSPL